MHDAEHCLVKSPTLQACEQLKYHRLCKGYNHIYTCIRFHSDHVPMNR